MKCNIGCYIEKAYLKKVERQIDEMHEQIVAHFLEEEEQQESLRM